MPASFRKEQRKLGKRGYTASAGGATFCSDELIKCITEAICIKLNKDTFRTVTKSMKG